MFSYSFLGIIIGVPILILIFGITFNKKINNVLSGKRDVSFKYFVCIIIGILIFVFIMGYSASINEHCDYTCTTKTKTLQIQPLPDRKEYFTINNDKITFFQDNKLITLLRDNETKFIKDNTNSILIEEKISTPVFNIFVLKSDREKCPVKKISIIKELHY